MHDPLALRRLRRTLLIHRCVQVLLGILLLVMALHFQELFIAQERPQLFRNSLLATLLVQFALFFPLRRLADQEAKRELAGIRAGLDMEELKRLRQQRLFADTLKGAVFLAALTFIVLAPPATFVLATTLFCFMVTIVTYLQCFNFTVRRQLAGQAG